jgi:hypothetical protein
LHYVAEPPLCTPVTAGEAAPKPCAAATDHVVHRWQVCLQPGADPYQPTRGNWPALDGGDYPTARRRRSADNASAGEIFQEIGGGRNAGGGFGHSGGDLTGPGDILRGEDGAQVRDQ